MIFIDSKSMDGGFHIALEEFIMNNFKSDLFKNGVFIIWQTNRTVMLGANQIASNEYDKESAVQYNVQIRRRPSGGGAMYLDRGNFLLTVITKREKGDNITNSGKRDLALPLVKALEKLGINAQLSGRNDITVNGKKISGIAQRQNDTCLCTHSSLLYDSNIEELVQVLTVDGAKIAAKGVSSVKSRVVNIREVMENGPEPSKFKKMLLSALLPILDENMAEHELKEEQIEAVHALMKSKYTNPSWIFKGEEMLNAETTVRKKARFSGGGVEVFVAIESLQNKKIIKLCTFFGDFLSTNSINELEKLLIGLEYKKECVLALFDSCDFNGYFGSIEKSEILSVMGL